MSQRWLYDQFRWNVGRLKRRTDTLNRMKSKRFAEAMQHLDGSSNTTQLYSSSQQVFPDSSTHIRSGRKRHRKEADSEDEEESNFIPSRKYKKSKKKKKKSAQDVNNCHKLKVSQRDENYSESNSESDLDLDKEMCPIQYYINNRSDMIHEMFRTLRGRKLKAMLPQILRSKSLSSIRDMCLAELEVMSKKRIGRLLAGHENDLISSSGTEESGSDGEEIKVAGAAPRPEEEVLHSVSEGIVDSTSKSHEDEDVVYSHPQRSANSSIHNSDIQTTSRPNIDLDVPSSSSLSSPQFINTTTLSTSTLVVVDLLDAQLGSPIEVEEVENNVNDSNSLSESADGKKKTQMEILELEMRARAIRAMLRKQESCDRHQGTTTNRIVKDIG